MKSRLTCLFAFFAAIAMAAPAFAQSQNQEDVQIERFEPLPAQGTNILNVAKSEVLPHASPSVGLFLHYMNDPLELVRENAQGEEERETVLGHSLKGEFWASFGLWDLLDIGVVVPVVLYQDGDNLAIFGLQEDLATATIADIRVYPKFQLMNSEDFGGFGAAVLLTTKLPTGTALNGDGTLGFEPRLILDYTVNDFVVDFNVAYAFRDEKVIQNYVANDLIRWAIGLEIPVIEEDMQILATFFGDTSFSNQRDPENPAIELDERVDGPMEADLALQYWFGDIVTQVGGGMGVSTGVGAPDFRVFASVGYTPRDRDKDKDGILDDDDDCPERPEDSDGFEDDDGCPDEDNDEDGILDDADQCRDEAEDKDGFEDENGCPDPDNDQDTVLDDDDECPVEAGSPELKGCPDKDGDLIIDRLDKCVDKAEDKDGFQDEDGCPDEDNDGDLILDVDDKCPMAAEDKDGFQDEDGCPDPDNDNDGILDGDDKCPLEPETINGNEDEDGCPDKGKTKVRVTKTKIEILEKVFFATGKAEIKKRSYNLLNQIASVLKTNPQITKIRIEGHTDSRGRDAFNQKLSQDRANSVRDYLEAQGIDVARMQAVGFGETRPIADNKKASGREQNRRVEFNILEVDGKPIGDGPAIIEKKEVIEEGAEKKPAPKDDKPADAKPADAKPADAKPSDAKPAAKP